MLKTFIQIVLILTLSFILIFTFYKYFHIESVVENTNENKIIETEVDKIIQENDKDSVIYNLSYKKFDMQNNAYFIEASKGTINENTNEVLMIDVKATINYKDNEELFIFSNNAIFNNKTFQTNFYNGVKLIFRDQKLESDNLDFLFDKNIAIFRDNVRYENLDTNMFSDEILINLLTKEVTISSKKKSKKVKIEKN
ncbi:LPS export ABC transporter periplasmic protein LptC [Candidatus Pelagibacter sp.]|nr:LPS export ABC transporter periplasmic protein LptC [Candidatus Pelagibacter sp.]